MSPEDPTSRDGAQLRSEPGHTDGLTAMVRLHELVARLLHSTELAQALEQVLDATIAITGAEWGNIQLLDPAARELRIVAQRGFSQEFLEHFARVRLGDESCCSRALESRRRIVIEDVEQDPDYAPHLEVAREAGYRGVQSTPLVLRNGDLLGVLATHYPVPYRPSEPDLRILDLYARQAAEFLERVRKDDEVRRSEERYRTLFDSIDEGFCTVEVLHDESGSAVDYRFLEVNPAFAAQTGLHDAEGRRMRELEPEHEEHWFEIYGEIARTGKPRRFVEEARHLGERWFDVYAFRIGDPEARTLGILFRDISERRRIEEQLRESDRMKQEFLAVLSHELRNPLAALSNGLALLEVDRDDPGRVEQARQMMTRQMDPLVRLVDDLLDVTRIERGTLTLRRTRTDLASVLRQAIDTCRTLVAGRDLEVDLPSQPIALDADPVRLAQVFGNLLHNACKFTETGGHVRIRAELEAGEAVVRMTDDGMGIESDRLSEVFAMFAQQGASEARLRGGLGVGLTLGRRLVEMHGGTIEARSDGTDRGSEFVVRLPVAATEAPAREGGPPPEVGPPSGIRLLVVDDNRDNADSMALLLRSSGNEVLTRYGGQEAVAAAADFRPDVVLLDIGLPDLDGYEVARRLRALPGGPEMVLVALTGWGQQSDRALSREAGLDHHLVKPVERDTLWRILAARS